MKNEKFLQIAKSILSKESKLIKIKSAKKIVFVGDTHGDLEASQKVIKDYLKKGNKIVFLGDYVDRGPYSKENLDFLLETKIKSPDQIYLLQGNHEGYNVLKFSPADFWESLSNKEYNTFSTVVEKMSLIVVTKDIIALHGALPNVRNLEEINKIQLGSEQWFQVTWGDFSEEPGEYLGPDIFTGRPRFGKDWFLKLMKRFNKKVLIRSHQPDCSQFMFENKCLTIFTSSAYTRERLQPAHHVLPSASLMGPSIAIADLTQKIRNAKDLKIIRI